MNDLRIFYRNIFIESILLFAVAIQIFSGLKLFFRQRNTISNPFRKIQIWSGLYLAFFLVIHVGAVLVGRLFLHLDTNFYFGVAGLNTFPLNLFFIPYYTLAIVSFFGHISAVHAIKMKRKIFGIDPKPQSFVILLIGIISSLVILYGLTNGFNGFKIPAEYDVLILK